MNPISEMGRIGLSHPRKLAHAMSTCLSVLMILATSSTIQAAESYQLISNGDYAIPTLIHWPDQPTKAPLVLMLHGTAGQKNEVGGLYQRLAKKLATKGIASARFDFAGTGQSPVDYQQYTLTSAVRDAQTVLKYLFELPEFDSSEIAVVGFSQGGLVAQLLVTDSLSPRINHLVTWATMASNDQGVFSDFYAQYLTEAQQQGFASVKFDWRDAPLRFSLTWFNELANNQSLERMKRFSGNILLIAGKEDLTVPYQQSERLKRTAALANSTLVLMDGANHLFRVIDSSGQLSPDQTIPNQLLNTTVDWLSYQLLSDAPSKER
ncbi:alpha/beta hydrolase family protein [Echinimonas agarilytica]|uniref:Lysophospholipase n=1 Tax=Echinimonas agarilytica TaxID=1215918 RepID=A0AA41W833_9GAMM|nr:alpha/beta fold hydrolase [Echinimonas agarilytica]MCM2680222.1 lysophospholipase [Echinimonas agarilytica]